MRRTFYTWKLCLYKIYFCPFAVTDFSNGQQSKMLALLEVDAKLSDEEVVKLGKKSPDR
jgi:hypothetical protein